MTDPKNADHMRVTAVAISSAIPIFFGCAAMAAPILSDPQVAQEVSGIVWCHDVERALVTRRPAWRCTGRIVDDARARQIRERRIRRIQGLMKEPEPLFKGRRLAGTGSGFVITTNGDVLTNWHVIVNCRGISFTPAGGEAMVTKLIAGNRSKDLALLQAPYQPTATAPFRTRQQLTRSEEVFVVGYPLHGKVAIRPILRTGIVTDGERGPRPGRFSMKIDVRRGNSGGPVLDRAGRIIGVVVAKVNTPNVYAATGRLIRNVGIAIRLQVVLDFLRQHDIAFEEAPTMPPATEAEIFSMAHGFVGQVGCWR